MNPKIREQIQRYADGQATESEVAALQTALREDAALRAYYLDYLNLDESLAAAAAASTVPELPPAVSAPTRLPFAWVRLTLRWIKHGAIGISAAVALVFLALWFQPGPQFWASVDLATGTRIVGSRPARVARPGESLRHGEWLEVGRDGAAQVSIAGLGFAWLGPGARLGQGSGARQLELPGGFIELAARKQASGRPWLIRTHEAEAAVLGTKFSLATAHGRTAMRVTEGLVRLTTLQNGRSEPVGGGRRAFVVGNGPPTVSPSRPGSVLLLTSRVPAEVNWDRFNRLIADQIVGHRLWELGFHVDIRHYDEVKSGDLRDRALVIVSLFDYGVGEPALERIHLAESSVPVLCLEPAAYPVLRMTGSARDVDHGFRSSPSQVIFSRPDHPLAGGFRDASDQLLHQVTSWGVPSAGATVIAHLPDHPEQAVLFAYEQGADLAVPAAGGAPLAPARRVGLFLDPFMVTETAADVWRLLEAAVDWCVTSEARP